MNTKKTIYILLLAFFIFGIFLLPSAIFNLSFVRFILSYEPILVIFGVLSLSLAFIISKNKKLGSILMFLFLSLISIMVLLIKIIDNQNTEKVNWNAPNDSVTIDFVVGKQGYIYFNALVNDNSGLFLFDTGASITVVNESFVADKKMKLHPYTITDSKGIQQTKDLYKVNNFVLGGIEIKRLQVYPKDSITWTAPKGMFYKQDSVIGVIGNNIISKFIWDFDLKNNRVTISKSKKYCMDIPDSLSVPLYSNNGIKNILVKINGVEKMLVFDFGASSPLSLSDTIPNRLANNKNRFSQNTIGALNHIDSTERKESNFNFVNVEFGCYKYSDIKCFENSHSDLFGLPFIWEFERVVLDYMNNKVYFINARDISENNGLINFNHEKFLHNANEIKMKTKPQGMVISISNDSSNSRYIFYGSLTVYQSKTRLDSIFYQDSLLLTNGKIKYGPSVFKFSN